MLKLVDRIFGALLGLAACGHTVGTFLFTQKMSGIFVWSLGSSLAAGLLATLNLVRAGRPNDKIFAVITLIGTACWALLNLSFGMSIGNVLDPRPLSHIIVSVVLVVFTGLTLLRSPSAQQTRLGDSAAAIAPRE